MPTFADDLRRARASLIEAELAEHPADKFLSAQLAAQRVAAVVLAVRTPRVRRNSRGRGGRNPSLRDVWQLLAETAPEYAEWAGFFGSLTLKRQAVEAGATGLVTAREADDLIRDAGLFHDQVVRRIGRLIAVRDEWPGAGHEVS